MSIVGHSIRAKSKWWRRTFWNQHSFSGILQHGILVLAWLWLRDMSAITWHDYVCVSYVEIGDIAGVADVTIRQSYRLIYLCAAERFPTDFQVTTPLDKLSNILFFLLLFLIFDV